MKDKPKAGLIINWLGREAAQVLKSMDVEADKLDEVFDALEKNIQTRIKPNISEI